MNNFERNYLNSIYFYVFWSKSTGLYKVGCCKNVKDRLKNFRSHKPAGVEDWIAVLLIYCGQGLAGPFESRVHSDLDSYRSPQKYSSKSENSYCQEIYNCDAETVLIAVESNKQESFDYREPNKMSILISKGW